VRGKKGQMCRAENMERGEGRRGINFPETIQNEMKRQKETREKRKRKRKG